MYRYANFRALLHMLIFSEQMDLKTDYEDNYILNLMD